MTLMESMPAQPPDGSEELGSDRTGPRDRLLFATSSVSAGAFRCSIVDPRFRHPAPIRHHSVVFHRAALWIRQKGSPRRAADQHVVTIFNAGREYQRQPISPEGDRSDWFAVSPQQAFAIAREHDPLAPEGSPTVFRFEVTDSDPGLYLRQRRLFLGLERGTIDPLEAEESILLLVGEVVAHAAGASRRRAEEPGFAARARRDLVEAARAELGRTLTFATDLTEIARQLGTSPYHLSRVFRKVTGQTLNGYRLELRIRAAIERLADPEVDLAVLALELGFSSQGHFTAAFRTRFGMTPTAARVMFHGTGSMNHRPEELRALGARPCVAPGSERVAGT